MAGKASGARFEISIDGKPRSHRDRKDLAIEAAEYLKRKFPNCDVVVKDLRSGEAPAGAYKTDTGPALMPLTLRPTGLSSGPLESLGRKLLLKLP